MKRRIIKRKIPDLTFIKDQNYIPDNEINKYYEEQYFPPLDYGFNDQFKYNTKGCYFVATKENINYLDNVTRKRLILPIENLKEYYLSPLGNMRSYWLDSIASSSYNIPDRVYHLAAVLKNEHPTIYWDTYYQLLQFEKSKREIIYRRRFNEQVFHKDAYCFDESVEILYEYEFKKYVQSEYSDDTLEEYLLNKIYYWESDINNGTTEQFN